MAAQKRVKVGANRRTGGAAVKNTRTLPSKKKQATEKRTTRPRVATSREPGTATNTPTQRRQGKSAVDSRLPSMVTDAYWVHAFNTGSREQGVPYGKWLVFVPPDALDATWAVIRQATEAGRLGHLSKSSTAVPNPNAKGSDKVICVYCPDLDEEIDRVRAELRALGFTKKMPYKTDDATRAGLYSVRGDQRISSRYE